MVTKSQFMSRPKIASLPLAQREARWKQHTQSSRGKRPSFKGKGRSNGGVTADSRAAAVSYTKRQFTGKPKIRQKSENILVSNKEFIFDLGMDDDWSLTQFVVNPGNSIVFPWLSKVAQNYESYLFKKLVFHYEPTCPTSTPGSVQMVMEFNVSDNAPTTKQQMMTYADAVRGAPWQPFSYRPRQQDINKRKTYFVDELDDTPTLPLAGGNSENLNDTGVLLIGKSNGETGIIVGEVYVEYVVELMTPQYNTRGTAQRFNSSTATGAGPFIGMTNVTDSELFLRITSDTQLTADRVGTYLIAIEYNGTSGLIDGSATTFFGGATTATIVNQRACASATNDDILGFAIVTFGQSEVLEINSTSMTSWGAGAVSFDADLYITPYPSGLGT